MDVALAGRFRVGNRQLFAASCGASQKLVAATQVEQMGTMVTPDSLEDVW
jgi:hypothetical protein